MSDRPLLFISAVSVEHRSLRGTIATLLDHEGYDTDFQEVFGTEHGDISDMLARRVGKCDGVIQLVGQCYGFARVGRLLLQAPSSPATSERWRVPPPPTRP
jgi:hypothetical protein